MNLQDFLNKNNVTGLKKKVTISKRLSDPDTGKLFEFEIKSLSATEYENARQSATIMPRNKKERIQIDNTIFNTKVIISGCISPNFKDAESIKSMNCMSPEDYLHRVLLPGEISDLSEEILKLSGFDKDVDEEIEEAKN